MKAKKGFFVRIDEGLREKLNLLSEKTGKSKSDIVRDALSVYGKDEDLMTLKMKGIIRGVKLEDVEEIYELFKFRW